MSSLSSKTVDFELYVGNALAHRDAASANALSPVETAVVSTSDGIRAIRNAIHYAQSRVDRHAYTIESTNGRVLFCSVLNIIIFIVVAAAQIYVIRGMFEKTRRA